MTQIIGSTNPESICRPVKSQSRAKACNGSAITRQSCCRRGQNRDVIAKPIGIGQVKDRGSINSGEIILDPLATNDINSTTAIGLGGANDQIVNFVAINISHQHRLTKILTPTHRGIGLN